MTLPVIRSNFSRSRRRCIVRRVDQRVAVETQRHLIQSLLTGHNPPTVSILDVLREAHMHMIAGESIWYMGNQAVDLVGN